MTILADVQENYIVWLLAGSRSQRWGYEEVLEVRQLLLRRGWGPNVCVWRLVGLGREEATYDVGDGGGDNNDDFDDRSGVDDSGDGDVVSDGVKRKCAAEDLGPHMCVCVCPVC